MDKISVRKQSFIDEAGRERIFNGVNLVFKGETLEGQPGKNYKPDWSEDMFKSLAAMGVNLIRFGLVWAAVEPQPGVYDEDYISHMERYIDLCGKYGIYVYLDMHQDLYSALFGGGAPGWATIADSYKFKSGKIIWAEGYFFSKAVQRSFDHFWNNTPVLGKGLQDYFADMWKYIAGRFKDKENLFGFDILNEPFPGTDGGKAFWKIAKSGVKTILSKKVKKLQTVKNIIKGDTVTEALAVLDGDGVMRSCTAGADMLIKKFDIDKYYPFFKKVSAAIREATDKGIIIMENSYYSNTGIPCSTPRLRYDDGKLEENFAFAPHAYDLTVDSVLTNTASNKRVDSIFAQHKLTQKRLDAPVIVGEWGGMVPGSDQYPHLEHLLESFDNNKWSQTYWCFWAGLEDSKIMKTIARPYPVAVTGEIESYGFNRKNNTFKLKFNNPGTRKKTVIFVPSAPKEVISKGKHTVTTDKLSGAIFVNISPVKGENEVEIKL